MWVEEEGEEASGPTFEDLAIDPELGDVDRVVKYATGAVELQRLVHVLMLAETARAAGYAVAEEMLFPLAEKIARDQEPVVRQNLTTQLAALCEFCHEQASGEAYETMIKVLLPVFKRLVSDTVQEVRESASVSLIQVADYVKEDDLMEHVLSIVLEMAHEESNDNLRITSAGLLNGLSTRFGPALCQQFCIAEMISLSQDPGFKVRRAVAYCLDKIIRVADICRDRLLPCFVRLCNDPIWGVRKACADSLALISESVDVEIRVDQLLPLSDLLASDKSKWVRGALSQRLGRFIASLPSNKIPDILIQRFVDMTKIDSGDMCWINKDAEKSANPTARRPSGVPAALRATADGLGAGQPPMDFGSNIMYCCAFNFPAVVVTSPERWESMLAPAFKSLAMCSHRHVRRTMSYALHEIARIVGPNITETTLVPVMKSFLLDVEEVRAGIVESLASIFAALSPESREKYLPILTELLGCPDPDQINIPPPQLPPTSAAFATFGALGLTSNPPSPFYSTSTSGYSEGVGTKWRFRASLASQMKDFCQLFTIQRTFSVIIPMSIKLMKDDVDMVRSACHPMVGPCLKRLRNSEENNKHQAFQDMILRFANSPHYYERQQFISIFLSLLSDPANISEVTSSFVGTLLHLATDPVPNVRLMLAKSLCEIELDPAVEFKDHLDSCLDSLRDDKDRDVAFAAGCTEDRWLDNSN